MKPILAGLLALSLVGMLMSGNGLADESEHGASTGGVGPYNAVTRADEHEGIQLSEQAQKTIGLKSIPFSGGGFPSSALVYSGDAVGVYRLRDAWFRRIPVSPDPRGGAYSAPASEFRSGDRIVVAGTALLRIAELDAFSAEAGHD